MATFRVGRKVGRTIYRQVGDTPSDADLLIGVLDTPEYAAVAVAGLNNAAGAVLGQLLKIHWPRTANNTTHTYCAECGGRWPCMTWRLACGEADPT